MRDTVLKVLDNAQYRTGSEQEVNFEKEFAQYVGTKYAVAVTSGAGALHIAASMLGLGPGDEVITAANTFTAAADCAMWVGAKPVFADIDRDTFNVDPDKVKKKITPKTKAIIPAHMYGHPADLDPIMEMAEQHGLVVIEDAAQAAGSKYKGKKTGSIAHMGIFSFAGKGMHCYGEGGMLTTNNKEYADNTVLYRHFGHSPDRFGEEQYVIGFNYTLGGWNAAMGRITLRLLDEWNNQRRENAKKYNEALKGMREVETPAEKDWAHHVYLHYVIQAERRDQLKEHLKQKGIETVVHYPIPIPLQKHYREKFGYKQGMYPRSEEAAGRILSLPSRPTLTEDEFQYVADSIKEFYA
jgi:dTDP-4-amino-4,6-dideoxygalactose transaminase